MEECPYCGGLVNINHDDDYGYDEGELHSQHCGHCENEFGFVTTTIFFYELSQKEVV